MSQATKVGLVLALIVAAALGGYYYSNYKNSPTTESATTTPDSGSEVCAQVITPARNPKTGEIKEFPTPCSVPNGWEVIQNDVPSLDLEVN